MTPAETLLAEARAAGVNLFVYRGELGFEAAPGALTPSLLVRLREAKPELYALLSAAAAEPMEAEKPVAPPQPVKRPTPVKPPETCPRCKRQAKWLPLVYPGRYLCGSCWFGVGLYPPGGPPPEPDPTTSCYCTSTRFWRSPAGVVRCAACYPPARPAEATWLDITT